MRKLDPREECVFNEGERLIPGISHDRGELIRHRSSYQFFRRLIERDLVLLGVSYERPLRVMDLGCGVGHGSRFLADIPGVEVVGIDSSKDSIGYASDKYAAPNVCFLVRDVVDFVPHMPEFDYIVSRHALEHVEEGIALGLASRWIRRLLLNVPFNESPDNPHHRVHWIRRERFPEHPLGEILYEDRAGVTHLGVTIPEEANSIIYARRCAELPSVAESLSFPLPAWGPSVLENLGLSHLERKSWSERLAATRVFSGARRLARRLAKSVGAV